MKLARTYFAWSLLVEYKNASTGTWYLEAARLAGTWSSGTTSPDCQLTTNQNAIHHSDFTPWFCMRQERMRCTLARRVARRYCLVPTTGSPSTHLSRGQQLLHFFFIRKRERERTQINVGKQSVGRWVWSCFSSVRQQPWPVIFICCWKRTGHCA